MNWFAITDRSVHCHEGHGLTENRTRRLLIEPGLAAAGYDIYDLDAVVDEAPVEHAGKGGGTGTVDYLIRHDNVDFLLVEAKAKPKKVVPESEARGKGANLNQVQRYVSWKSRQTRWIVLTNGIFWELFDGHMTDRKPDERIVLQLDLRLGSAGLALLSRQGLAMMPQAAEAALKAGCPIKNDPAAPTFASFERLLAMVTNPDAGVIAPVEPSPGGGRVRVADLSSLRRGMRPVALHVGGSRYDVTRWSDVLPTAIAHVGPAIHAALPVRIGQAKVIVAAPGDDLPGGRVSAHGVVYDQRLGARDVLQAAIALLGGPSQSASEFYLECQSGPQG